MTRASKSHQSSYTVHCAYLACLDLARFGRRRGNQRRRGGLNCLVALAFVIGAAAGVCRLDCLHGSASLWPRNHLPMPPRSILFHYIAPLSG